MKTDRHQQIFDNIKKSLHEYSAEFHNFAFDPENPVVRLHEPTFAAEEISAAIEPMLTTFVTMGKKVKKFEGEYSNKFDHKYSLMNNSGSSANLLAVSALANPLTKNRLNPGDEVIVPALSWSTTVWPLIQNNLVPVIVDADPKTWNLDLEKLEKAITPKTKAIMLVHVYGNPCDMDAIMSLAKKYDLQVIEDCCEAMGASYKNKAVGKFGRAGTFSLYFSHHITSFEGGIVVTDDFDFIETMRVLRAHGWSREAEEHEKYVKMYPEIDPRFIFINIGYNLRPTEMQAAAASVQLPKLDEIVEKRRENASFYYEELKNYKNYFKFQNETNNAKSSWFGYGLVIKESAPFKASELAIYLKEKNIETRPIIAGNIAKHPVMAHYNHRVSGGTEVSDDIMRNGLAFGCHQSIDHKAREYVVSSIKEFIKARG
ncbi:MAG: aminotransferase class V-fold PLP-dependent enzyme [Rickettsiales bacterium]